MNEKPIIFSTPMVKAILEGRKTQTRRVIKPQPESDFQAGLINGQLQQGGISHRFNKGDILWVRETFSTSNRSMWKDMLSFQSGDAWTVYKNGDVYLDGKKTCALRNLDIYPSGKKIKWKPSIFMPHGAARIFLEVKSVRVERLQDISEKDVLAEGFRDDVNIETDKAETGE